MLSGGTRGFVSTHSSQLVRLVGGDQDVTLGRLRRLWEKLSSIDGRFRASGRTVSFTIHNFSRSRTLVLLCYKIL